MALNLRHQTPEQFALRVREKFRSTSGADTWAVATRVLDWLDAGNLTDAQMRAAFGLSLAQWGAFKARLNTMRSRNTELKSAAGE